MSGRKRAAEQQPVEWRVLCRDLLGRERVHWVTAPDADAATEAAVAAGVPAEQIVSTTPAVT